MPFPADSRRHINAHSSVLLNVNNGPLNIKKVKINLVHTLTFEKPIEYVINLTLKILISEQDIFRLFL